MGRGSAIDSISVRPKVPLGLSDGAWLFLVQRSQHRLGIARMFEQRPKNNYTGEIQRNTRYNLYFKLINQLQEEEEEEASILLFCITNSIND